MMKRILAATVLSVALAAGFAHAAAPTAENPPKALSVTPAREWDDPTRFMMLDATLAGSRIVAVGEHGIVLLSDDNGKTFRQARHVAASSTLTSVYFVDAQHGWAVGQWGVILSTSDGGETWTLQRSDTSIDQPLFSVYFKDTQRGWATGLWGLLLATQDGGKTWVKQPLPPRPGGARTDLNLYKIFADHVGTLFITAEKGIVLRSRDDGTTWEYLQTGNEGSLWSGAAGQGNVIVVGGLLGHMYRSADGGDTWQKVQSGATGSITDLVSSGDHIFGVGLDGFLIQGALDATGFSASQRPDHAALTAVVVPKDGVPLLFSKNGALTDSRARP